MLFLHLLLLIASCIANPVVTSTLELSSTTRDNGFLKYAHSELAIYMRSIGVDEFFVSKDLIIDDNSYGPCYLNLNVIDEANKPNQFIYMLDFGKDTRFEGLDPDSKSEENRKAIGKMFEILTKREIFANFRSIHIEHFIVNRIDYGVYIVKGCEPKYETTISLKPQLIAATQI